jgi:hypothetical protein
MLRRRRVPLEDKLVMLAIVIFVFGLVLMMQFGEIPFAICLVFSLALCVAGMLNAHREDRLHRRNRYLP